MIDDLLRALTLVGNTTPAVVALVNAIEPLLHENDQVRLREALAQAQASNDVGYVRLNDKLDQASKE